MKYKLVVLADAITDTIDAYNYYEKQQRGLGELFLNALETKYGLIAQNPELYSFVGKSQFIRDVKLKRFPFLINFRLDGKNVVILRVHNTHKRPKKY